MPTRVDRARARNFPFVDVVGGGQGRLIGVEFRREPTDEFQTVRIGVERDHGGVVYDDYALAFAARANLTRHGEDEHAIARAAATFGNGIAAQVALLLSRRHANTADGLHLNSVGARALAEAVVVAEAIHGATERAATKPCLRCRADLPADEQTFHRNAARPTGLSDYCRACTREYNAERRRRLERVANGMAPPTSPIVAVALGADALVGTMRELRFGVEIEVAMIDGGAAAAALRTVVGPTWRTDARGDHRVAMADGREWTVTRDGSIHPFGCEVVSPILTWADMDLVQRVVRALRGAGAKANRSCGLHVHVGCESMTARHLGALAGVVFETQDALVEALGVHESRVPMARMLEQGTAAALLAARDVNAINRAWYGTSRALHGERKYHPSRYRVLNLHSYFLRGTAEFRWANGTVHAGKVKAAIHLALALVAYARLGGQARLESAGRGREAVERILDKLGLVGEEFRTVRHHLLARYDAGDDDTEAN
jgi:hypothetical protein